jgi:MFS family permease
LWAAIIVVLVFIGAAFLPRWWSHVIGGQVNGSIAVGVILGLFYGFLFTFLPLLALRWALRRRRSLNFWIGAVMVMILLAGPNLLTLGIVLGHGNAAHAGERTLDVDAPAYRGAVLAGAIAAVLVFVFGEYVFRSRRRGKRELENAQHRLQSQHQIGERESD